MPPGAKSACTDKQKRKAERRGWATVNKEQGGAKKSGSGREN